MFCCEHSIPHKNQETMGVYFLLKSLISGVMRRDRLLIYTYSGISGLLESLLMSAMSDSILL